MLSKRKFSFLTPNLSLLGAEMVLGPAQPSRDLLLDKVPPEMALERQKNLPGSGSLSVRVLTDGPTRVLQIMDIMKQVNVILSRFQG